MHGELEKEDLTTDSGNERNPERVLNRSSQRPRRKYNVLRFFQLVRTPSAKIAKRFLGIEDKERGGSLISLNFMKNRCGIFGSSILE
jgi:hypothetical protein